MTRGPIDMEDRIAALEKSIQRQGESISAVTHDIASKGDLSADHGRRLTLQNDALVSQAQRIAAIEEARRLRQLEEVRQEEQDKARTKEISEVVKRLDGIDGAVSRVIWLIVGCAVAAVLAFVFKGGLT